MLLKACSQGERRFCNKIAATQPTTRIIGVQKLEFSGELIVAATVSTTCLLIQILIPGIIAWIKPAKIRNVTSFGAATHNRGKERKKVLPYLENRLNVVVILVK